MSYLEPSFSVNVDVTNPGQFFACCGLLELAHRLWRGAEGWFSSTDGLFNLSASSEGTCTLAGIVEKMLAVGIEGELSTKEGAELAELESRKRTSKKEGKKLSKQDEERRASLGKQGREGAVTLGQPFNLRVDWWQENGDDVPKTFAGRQDVLRMARAMLSATPEAIQDDRPLEYRCLLRSVGDESQETNDEKPHRKGGQGSKVEPFYFDAVRFAHALDAGFSLDVQEQSIRASAAPLTELLSLIGLQRFRARSTANHKWTFEYFTWAQPLGAATGAAVACGTVAATRRRGYRFRLQFRDDQKRYKAFGFATPMGEDA